MPRKKIARITNAPLMYTSHPEQNALGCALATDLAMADSNQFEVSYEQVCNMRKTIRDLASVIEAEKPNLVPFFATGGIPFIFPLMDVLAQLKAYELLDGSVFHMFPGLTWSGNIGKYTSKEFFHSEFTMLLRNAIDQEPNVKILCIDTTNSGNAVNVMVDSIIESWNRSKKVGSQLSLMCIGLVNRCHEENQRPSASKHSVQCSDERRFVSTPSGWSPSSILCDRQFTKFSSASEFLNAPNLQIAYWFDDIPTEDNAGLLGAHASHDILKVDTSKEAGRIVITHENLRRQSDTGLNAPGSRFLHLLGVDKNSVPWTIVVECASQKQLLSKDKATYEKIQQMSLAALKFFELHNSDEKVALNALSNAKRVLTEAEIYWLSKYDNIPNTLLLKVVATVLKKPMAKDLAIEVFRRNRSTMAAKEAIGSVDDVFEWWHAQLKAEKSNRS